MSLPFFTQAAVAVGDNAGADTIGNFPTNVNPDDVFVAIFVYKSGTSSGINWPGDFTEFQAENGASGVTIWLAYHVCDGSEGGTTYTVDHATTTTGRLLQGWCFRGCDPAAPLIVPSSYVLARGTDASVEQGVLTSTGLNRLGVAVIGVGDDFTVSDFVGEVGGDWMQRDYASTALGTDAAVQMCTVDMPNVATVKSGVATLSGGASTWTCSTFALKPLVERDFTDEPGARALIGHSMW